MSWKQSTREEADLIDFRERPENMIGFHVCEAVFGNHFLRNIEQQIAEELIVEGAENIVKVTQENMELIVENWPKKSSFVQKSLRSPRASS